MACHILQDHERLMLKISSSLSCKIAVNIAGLLFLVNFFCVFVNAISGGNNCKIFFPSGLLFLYLSVSLLWSYHSFKDRIAFKSVMVPFLPCCWKDGCSSFVIALGRLLLHACARDSSLFHLFLNSQKKKKKKLNTEFLDTCSWSELDANWDSPWTALCLSFLIWK